MPVAELDCEICGRRGDVIPCNNAEWCQNGRCLKCHTSILGQTKYYPVAYDILLTCESCIAYGDGCVVEDDEVEALLGPRAASPGGQPAVAATEPQKRLLAADESPQRKRQRAAVSQAASAEVTGKASSASQEASKDKPTTAMQQRQAQPSLAPKITQQQQQQQQRPFKATPPKRPAAMTQPSADGPPVKRPTVQLDTTRQQQLENNTQVVNKQRPQEQAHALAALKRQQQQEERAVWKPDRGQEHLAAAPAVGAVGVGQSAGLMTKGGGAGGAQAAAALAIGHLRRQSSQASTDSGSRSHTLTLGNQQSQQQNGLSVSQHAATGGKAGIDGQHVMVKPRQDAASAAAALASKAAAMNGTHDKSHDRGQSDTVGKATTQANGVDGKGKQLPQLKRRSILPSGIADNHIPAKAVGAEASKRLAASGANGVDNSSYRHNMSKQQRQGLEGPALESADQDNSEPGGIRQGDADAMRHRAKKRMKSAGPKLLPVAPDMGVTSLGAKSQQPTSGQQRPKVKPFSLMEVQVQQLGVDPSEDFDKVNTSEEPLEDLAPAPMQPQASIRATRPGGSGQAQANDWVGRASIELDDMVDMDVRISPEAGVPLPPLLQSLKAHQDNHIDGGLVTRAVMDRRVQKESGQGSDVQLKADFTKVLVMLKERAFGQGKQLHTLISKMVDTKRFLKLQSDSKSVFFGPIVKSRLVKAHNMELADYNEMLFNKHDLFEQVYNDRLGLIYHLKPGEELPSCKSVQFIQSQCGATKGGGWDKNQTAKKSNLKKESIQHSDRLNTLSFEAEGSVAAAQAAPPTTTGPTIYHDDEQDDWLDDTGFVGFGSTGIGDASTSLAVGVSAHKGGSGFMAHEDSQVPHLGYVGASGGGLQSLDSFAPACSVAKPFDKGLNIQGVTGGMVEQLQVPLAEGHVVSSTGVASGTSPTTPEQQLPVTPVGLQRQLNSAELGLIPSLFRSERVWPKHKLMPGVEGLCKWLQENRMERMNVHIDKTLAIGDPHKAQELEAWMRAQGANVTSHPHAPCPGEVHLLVVRKQGVLTSGMEGASSSIAVNHHLLHGIHVVSESFIDGLQRSNLHLGPELLGRDKEARHWQFFATGVNLLWDETLIKYSQADELIELLQALKEAAVRMGPSGGSYKAFVTAHSKELLGRMQQIDKWTKECTIEDLPAEYASTSSRANMPQILQDAIKAVFLINNTREALRYMVIVVPNPSEKLSAEDVCHVEHVLKAASDQKTVYAATLSQTIKLLHLLSS